MLVSTRLLIYLIKRPFTYLSEKKNSPGEMYFLSTGVTITNKK